MSKAVTTQEIALTVNGKEYSMEVHPMKRLLDILREDLGLTGSKEGCGEGECGACAVHMDDKLVLSCTVPACQADGSEITTIEGLSDDGRITAIQEAFHKKGGAQCGICTPGMIMATTYFLDHPDSADSIREALAGNQCRCTGYKQIIDSVKEALQNL
ncbi:MAG: (2Fe-2S)-binding protein [bacterium]